jgi:hypothetical protein
MKMDLTGLSTLGLLIVAIVQTILREVDRHKNNRLK